MQKQETVQSPWRRRLPDLPTTLLLAAIAAAGAFLFSSVLSALFQVWKDDPDNSHGMVVPFLAGYLVWRQHKKEPLRAGAASGAGLAVFVLSLLLFLTGWAGGLEVFQRVAMLTALHGAVWYNGGWALYRRLMFPLFFLFLMVPLPVTIHAMIAFPLQIFATTCSKYLLTLMSIPVVQAGNVLHTPRGTLEVVEACSGLRSLMAFLSISIFIAYLSRVRPWAKVVLVASTVPIALAANIVRITAAGWLGYVYGMKLARGFMHDLSGFVLFLLGLGIFLLEAQLLEEILSAQELRRKAKAARP